MGSVSCGLFASACSGCPFVSGVLWSLCFLCGFCLWCRGFLLAFFFLLLSFPRSLFGSGFGVWGFGLARSLLASFNTLRAGKPFSMARPTPIKDAAVLAKSITQLTLCQVTTSEVDAATKLLDKACQKLQGIQNIPSQRVTDLEAAIRLLRQISCILDSCTISASYEVSQAQKAILLLPHTAKGASTSSEELNAQISPRTDDEHNLPYHEDYGIYRQPQ